MGGGVCQALFLRWQTDTDADADVYCIYTIDIYKRGWESRAVIFFRLLGRLDSRGVSVRKQVLVFCSYGALVWRYLSSNRKMDSISKGDPF